KTKKTKRISKYLKSKKVLPDLFISSSAVRAFETARLIAKGIGYETDAIDNRKELYHAGIDEIYDELFSIDNSVNSVMIFGHNPTFTFFVNNFVSPEIDNLPTSGVVGVEFKANSWESIANAKFKVNFVVFPRMLK
ncbi:MAG: histidine phosphatase, partial [Bacteroidetes bacterium]|nr:histidine phosphatase [Bacteroidota bacterium]